MRTVQVHLRGRDYPIRIGVDTPLGETLVVHGVRRAMLLSDTHVAPLYADVAEAKLCAHGVAVSRAVVPAGEASKDLDVVRRLYEQALDAGLDRSSALVALGGGMIGDLAGFVAGTWMRGIGFLQAPTSLLAMVDSSIGGKTGVNLPRGKNLVGVFHQPWEVSADLRTLATLPDREYRSGLAEVVKYGVIQDAELFGWLESDADRLLQRDLALLEEVIARCCAIKAHVVAADEYESGQRAILNFGHTFGHALEQTLGFGHWLHGEAVAVGMVFAAAVSAKVAQAEPELVDRLRDLLRRLGLPVALPAGDKTPAWTSLRSAIAADKKKRDGRPRWVLVSRLGSATYGCSVPETVLERCFRELCADL